MKKKLTIKKRILISLFVMVVLLATTNQFTANAEAPYNTYTSDRIGRVVPSPEAYTPMEQITAVNGEKFNMPEHVFVDKQDYIYITDSGSNKVYILNPNYQYYKELSSDLFSVIKSAFVTENEIYVVDSFERKIFIFDKKTHEFLREIGQPDSPIFKEGYKFSPTNIAVDIRGNIYIRSTGSVNGLIMLSRTGEFLTFFGANPLKVPLTDKIRAFFLTEVQEDKLKKVFPDVPSNIAIDKKGFVYTVTSSIETNPIKKFNVAGKNYFNDSLVATYSMESVWVGQYNNIFSVSSEGWIFEYEATGNLLFLFGGKDFTSSRLGLLNRPISIASNSRDEIIVVDQGTKLIQTYKSTEFTDAVHSAMDAYQKGDYQLAKELWKYTLEFNALFDIAHIGLGDAYLRDSQYLEALKEYKYARFSRGMSDAFWEIRQDWMERNLNLVFLIIFILVIIRYTFYFFDKRYNYSKAIKHRLSFIRRNRIVDELLYIFDFLKHPLNGYYDLKTEHRVSSKTSTIIYILILAIYVLHKKFTNELFVPKYYQYVVYDLTIIAVLFALWMISNYLICSISDGEGSFSNVYNATAFALSPILVVMPPVILISNFFTLEQEVFYRLPIQMMFIWIVFLMFFMIKDIHNYEVGETNSVIVRSFFTMLIIGLFMFVFYAIGSQLYHFVYDLITEAIKR